MKPYYNYVLVEIDNSNEWIDLGVEKIKIDVSFEPERRAQQLGKVIQVGELLFGDDPHSLQWKTENELAPGDEILFHYLTVNDAKNNGRILGPNQIIIRYDEIFCTITNGVKPVNGWVFVEPVIEEINSALIIPDIARGKKSMTFGKIKFIGTPVGYIDGSFDCMDLEIGDEILFARHDAVPIQDELRPVLGNLYRMHRTDILIKMKDFENAV